MNIFQEICRELSSDKICLFVCANQVIIPNNIPVEPSNSSKLVESNKILTDKIAVTHAMNKFAAPQTR